MVVCLISLVFFFLFLILFYFLPANILLINKCVFIYLFCDAVLLARAVSAKRSKNSHKQLSTHKHSTGKRKSKEDQSTPKRSKARLVDGHGEQLTPKQTEGTKLLNEAQERDALLMEFHSKAAAELRTKERKAKRQKRKEVKAAYVIVHIQIFFVYFALLFCTCIGELILA